VNNGHIDYHNCICSLREYGGSADYNEREESYLMKITVKKCARILPYLRKCRECKKKNCAIRNKEE